MFNGNVMYRLYVYENVKHRVTYCIIYTLNSNKTSFFRFANKRAIY